MHIAQVSDREFEEDMARALAPNMPTRDLLPHGSGLAHSSATLGSTPCACVLVREGGCMHREGVGWAGHAAYRLVWFVLL